MGERLAAVSIDLDEIPCYAAIHGIELDDASSRAIYRHALARFERLFDDLDLRATFFAIGQDIDDENAPKLRRLADAGHEVANHSLSHLYDLSRRTEDEVRYEVRAAADLIESATGIRPVGFRAPGYTITRTVFDALELEGVAYDSSVFPCPAYYGAKAAAIGAYAVRAKFGRGRPSHSVIDDPRVLRAPANPYRIGRPYWTRGTGLLELPIGVTRGARLPFIGTSVALAGPRGADWLARAMVGRPLVSLELHGIDLADADQDGLQQLRPHQPDLRRSAEFKEASLRAAITRLRHAGYTFLTCAQAADHFA